MTDIQRWDHYVSSKMTVLPEEASDGEYVTYADHLAAVQQAEQRTPKGYLWVEELRTAAYEQGQRDMLVEKGYGSYRYDICASCWFDSHEEHTPKIGDVGQCGCRTCLVRDAIAAAVQRVEALIGNPWDVGAQKIIAAIKGGADA